MPILVTGAAGFIGSHLVEMLHDRTDEPIVGIDNFNDYYEPSLKRSNAETLASLERFELVEGDFCDEACVETLFRDHQVDRVVHLGAYAGVRYSVQQPLVYEQVNVGGTLKLLEAARVYSAKRFLLISSSTVYGRGAGIPFRESAPLGIPASPYGATKRAAELMGLTYHQLHGVPVVCLRPFSVYGPRLRPDLALTIFAKAIYRGTSFPLYGDGSIRRDFTHVSDICSGLFSALYTDGIDGEEFNLGHSEPIEMRYVIELLERFLERPANIDRKPERPEDLPVTYADVSKAKKLLGYDPQVEVEEGFRDYCAWFREWHADHRSI